MAERVAVLIDGAYLDFLLNDVGLFGRIDFGKFATELSGSADLLRAYYYHCPPNEQATPTEEESARFAQMESFFTALDRLPRFLVRRGRLEFRGTRQDGRPIFQQKRVDVLLAADAVLLSTKRQIGELVLVTGDSDFLPAVQIAKDEGVVVRLAHGVGRNRPHNELWDAADERVQLTGEWFESCLKA